MNQLPQNIEPAPDIETASDRYRTRFAGPIGRFFLHVQRKSIQTMIEKFGPSVKTILEVGGGHAQLTETFLRKGYQVTVHGSALESLARMTKLRERYPDQLQLLVGDFTNLPLEDKSYDAVISIRLLPHVNDSDRLLNEFARLAKKLVVVDFAPRGSFNVFYPILFQLKKRMEGNTTRTYHRHSIGELKDSFRKSGFKVCTVKREFFLPMVLHRWMNKLAFSVRIEAVALVLGLTSIFGSPAIMAAEECEDIFRRTNRVSVSRTDLDTSDPPLRSASKN